MPTYSSSAWKPVRASPVPLVVTGPVLPPDVPPGSVPPGGGGPPVGAVVGGVNTNVVTDTDVGGGGGPSWSFSVNGVMSDGVHDSCSAMEPVSDVVVTVPGVNTTGVPVPDLVKVTSNGPCVNGM